jgi:hypothetical protein
MVSQYEEDSDCPQPLDVGAELLRSPRRPGKRGSGRSLHKMVVFLGVTAFLGPSELAKKIPSQESAQHHLAPGPCALACRIAKDSSMSLSVQRYCGAAP